MATQKPYNDGAMTRQEVFAWQDEHEARGGGYDPHLSSVLRDVFADREGEYPDAETMQAYQAWLSANTDKTFEEWRQE